MDGNTWPRIPSWWGAAIAVGCTAQSAAERVVRRCDEVVERAVAMRVNCALVAALGAGCAVPAPPGVRAAERIAAAADELGADVWEANGAEAALAGLPGLLEDEVRRAGGKADLLLLVDAGATMFETVRGLARAPELFAPVLALGARVAVGSYRSYADSFVLRVHPFVTAPEDLARVLGSLKAWGGRARRPMWSALSEALHGLRWGAGRTPVVVIVTGAAPTDEPGARAGARAWLAEHGARVQLVRVLTAVRSVVLPPPVYAAGLAAGASGHPVEEAGAASLVLGYLSVRAFGRLRFASDFLYDVMNGAGGCRAAEARVALRAGWDWPGLGFTVGASGAVSLGPCARARIGPSLVPSATLRIGAVDGLSVRAALFAADLDAAPGLPLVRGALVYEGRRLRLSVGLGALPPAGPAVTYALAVRVWRWPVMLELGVDGFAGVAPGPGTRHDELAYGVVATLGVRTWRWPFGR